MKTVLDNLLDSANKTEEIYIWTTRAFKNPNY